MAQTDQKTVIALSRAYDQQMPVQLNALGHLSMAMGMASPDSQQARYQSHDGIILAALSWWPLIVLSGRPGKITGFWQALHAGPLVHACFTESMVRGGSEMQLQATAGLAIEEQAIIAVAAHGPAAEIDALTKRLSLWKPPSPEEA